MTELFDLIKEPELKAKIKEEFGNLIKDPKLKKPIEKELRDFIEDPKLKVVLEKELENKRDSKCKNNLEKKLEDFIEDSKLKPIIKKAGPKANIEKKLLYLNELNPWKDNNIDRFDREEFVGKLGEIFSEGEESLRDLLEKLPGIADEDKKVFIPLLAINIIINIGEAMSIRKKEEKKDPCCKEKFPSDTLAILVTLMICLPFMDYQQAFDGNFYDPRVIILGINPRFKADTFYDYGQKEEKKFMVNHMKEVYSTPIRDENRPMLYKMDENDDENGEKIEPTDLHIAEDDYYYGKPGKFYAEYIDKKFIEKHRHLCLKKEKAENEDRNPIAFLELFPYASNGIGTWWDGEDLDLALTLLKLLEWDGDIYNALKTWVTDNKKNMDAMSDISCVIKKMIGLNNDELLYSQQWILCLLYCILIKNSKSKKNSNWFVISTRYAGDHLKRLEAFIDTAIKIEENPSFCFLACNSIGRHLTPNGLSVVENGAIGKKINEFDATRFWNVTLNNLAFRVLWGI